MKVYVYPTVNAATSQTDRVALRHVPVLFLVSRNHLDPFALAPSSGALDLHLRGVCVLTPVGLSQVSALEGPIGVF